MGIVRGAWRGFLGMVLWMVLLLSMVIRHQGLYFWCLSKLVMLPGYDEVFSIQGALLYYETEQWEETVRCCLKYLEEDPEHPLITRLLGDAYMRLGDYAPAVGRYEDALDYGSKELGWVYFMLGYAQHQLGRLKEARESLERSLAAGNGEEKEALVLLGRVLIDLGEDEEALRVYLRAAELPGKVEQDLQLGWGLYYLDAYDKSIPFLRRGLAEDEGEVEARIWLVHALLETGDYARAEVELEKLGDVETDHLRRWKLYLLGRAHGHGGRMEEAVACLEELEGLDGEMGEVLREYLEGEGWVEG